MSPLRYLIGPLFIREKGRWYFKLGFYWFSITLWRRWHPEMRYLDGPPCPWNGITFYYKLNPELKEGELIWLKNKRWMWPASLKETKQSWH